MGIIGDTRIWFWPDVPRRTLATTSGVGHAYTLSGIKPDSSNSPTTDASHVQPNDDVNITHQP